MSVLKSSENDEYTGVKNKQTLLSAVLLAYKYNQLCLKHFRSLYEYEKNKIEYYDKYYELKLEI